MTKNACTCFDRGYLDYERFDRMTDDGYFFLSRLRKNAVIREVYNFKLPENTSVLSDQMVLIGTIQNRAENYFRLLKVLDSKGNELHLITNRFDLGADEISEMYKSRWAIELFFKMDQTTSEHQKILRSERMGDSKSSIYRANCFLPTHSCTN